MAEQGQRFWDTCYTGDITACVTFAGGAYDGSNDPNSPFPWNEPNQFIGSWDLGRFTGSEPFRITAWGMKFPGNAEIDWFYGDDAVIPGDPLDFGWKGFSFVHQYSEWDFAIGGPNYDGAAWRGYWISGKAPSLAGTSIAWRGETEDHRLVFDCVQTGPGSTKCRKDAAATTSFGATFVTTTVTPEPSTFLLLLTGLALAQLVRRYARRVRG